MYNSSTHAAKVSAANLSARLESRAASATIAKISHFAKKGSTVSKSERSDLCARDGRCRWPVKSSCCCWLARNRPEDQSSSGGCINCITGRRKPNISFENFLLVVVSLVRLALPTLAPALTAVAPLRQKVTATRLPRWQRQRLFFRASQRRPADAAAAAGGAALLLALLRANPRPQEEDQAQARQHLVTRPGHPPRQPNQPRRCP